MAVKKNIEDAQGKGNYPCGQQLLIHNGKVLKDETTLADNKVTEDGFHVVMLSKTKTLGSAGASSTQPIVTEINYAIGAEGIVSNECKEFIYEYGDQIWDLLASGVQPNQVCSQLGLCIFNCEKYIHLMGLRRWLIKKIERDLQQKIVLYPIHLLLLLTCLIMKEGAFTDTEVNTEVDEMRNELTEFRN